MTQHKQYKSFVRRIVPLFLCVVMIANMLSGCGPSSLTMNITGWSKLFGFFKDKTDDNKVERTGSFSENLKEGWDYAEKYLSSQLSSQKGADYVKKVSDAIEKLQKDINKSAESSRSVTQEAGYIAEKWHADTFNINAAASGSSEYAITPNSTALGSADVITSYQEEASLKYYQSASGSASAQAKTVLEAYAEYYRASENPLSWEEYLLKHGFDSDVSALYSGQIRIIPSNQMEDAIAYLKGAKSSLPETVKAYQETLDKLRDRLQAPDGTQSTPATYEEMQAIAELAQKGEFRPEDFNISTAQIITPKYILKQAVGAGLSAATFRAVLTMGPDFYSIIRDAIKTGNLDNDRLKEAGMDGICNTSEGFLEGSISFALITACETGKLGNQFKNISPNVVGTLVVLIMDAMRYGYGLANNEISLDDYGNLIAEEIVAAAVSNVAGISLTLLLPMFPIAYMAGSMAGGMIAMVGYKLAMTKVKELSIELNAAGGFEAFLPEGFSNAFNVLKGYFSKIDIRTAASSCKDLVMRVFEDGCININLQGYYYCPNCDANLNKQRGFNPENGYWECKKCGQYLFGDNVYSGERFIDTMWFCDSCEAFLNMQTGFNDLSDKWECKECGHINPITEEAIVG